MEKLLLALSVLFNTVSYKLENLFITAMRKIMFIQGGFEKNNIYIPGYKNTAKIL